MHFRNILPFSQFGFSATINLADGNFNITGNGVDGEGTYTISNGTAEIGLHVVIGEMAQKQEVVITGDKGAVNSLKTTSLTDHTETELTFTKEGKMWSKIHYSCILFTKNFMRRVRHLSYDITKANIRLLKTFLIIIKLFSFWKIECLISKVDSLLYNEFH